MSEQPDECVIWQGRLDADPDLGNLPVRVVDMAPGALPMEFVVEAQYTSGKWEAVDSDSVASEAYQAALQAALMELRIWGKG